MVKVKRKPGEDSGSLIARFRNKVRDWGIIDEARDNARYEPPSEKRKKKKKEIQHKIKLQKKRNER
ncbi:30S ribosomal protein S21 [Candidatus Woesebacteria bacterium]|nr:30S ribosomal protein S21 [Candidatus Woesebacteria bacterium]